MAHEAILTARGISESTWANIGWIPMTLGEFKRKHLNIANANETNDGWCLPIFLRLDDSKKPVYAYRWKSLHKSNDPRFLWSKQDKGEVPFYFLPSHKVKEQRLALAEVINTTKNLWIFSGESDYATAIEIFGQPVGVHVFGESRHSDEIFTLDEFTAWIRWARSQQRNANLTFNLPRKHETIIHKYRDWETDRKSTRLNSSHSRASRMPSSA